MPAARLRVARNDMGLDWSFSSERCFRRCQRQYFFREIAAWHNGRDPLRREAFVLKQLKSLETWRGSVVHTAIERFVVPYWKSRQPVDWNAVIQNAKALAARQFAFSSSRRFRENGLSKSKAGDDYCALQPHENGQVVSAESLNAVTGAIEGSLTKLSQMSDLLKYIEGRPTYFTELAMSVNYNEARINGQIDLMFFRGFGQPTIIDWKCYESVGGSDADLQTALYAWLLCKHPKWNVASPENVELVEVRLGREPMAIHHRPDASKFIDLEDRIFRSVEEIRSLCGDAVYTDQILSDFAFTENPNSCAYCPFRTLCQETEVCSTMF
jgi:PD-(D/E)XK nuclease superfamily